MADKILVSGAKDVAQAKGSGNLAAAKAGAEVGGFLADNLGKMIQKRNNEFNRLMEAELEAAGEMTHEQTQEMMKRLKGKRAGYVLLNKRGRVNAEKELLKEAEEKKKEIITKTEVVEKIIDDVEDKTPCDCIEQDIKKTDKGWEIDPRTVSADGKTKTSIHGHIYPNTPEGQAIYRAHAESDWQAAGGQALDFTNPETLKETWHKDPTYQELKDKDIRVIESHNSDNNRVIMNDNEYKGLVDYLSVDKGSQQKINTVVQSVTEDANAFVGGDTSKEFNYEAVKNNVMNNIMNSKDVNLRSLATDTIWGGTSWKTDMEEALTKGNYEDFGITQEHAKSNDPTPKTPITARDAAVITKAIMKDEKLLKETLGDYYTRIAERNYNAQAGKNKKKDNK